MKTILIVDDHIENLYLLRVILEEAGYVVIEAMDGKEGLEKLYSASVDMIISDILMPVMDGYLFCQACKKEKLFKKIPFIFYSSSYTEANDIEFALKLGAAKFIKKPLDLDKLLFIVEDIFDKIKSQKEYVRKVRISEEEVLKLYSERLINKLELKNKALLLEIETRQKTERILAENENIFRSIYENSNDAIVLISNNKFTKCNSRTLEMLGFNSEKEFLRKSIKDILPETQCNGISSYKLINNHFKNANQNKLERFDFDFKRKKGEIFKGEVILNSLVINNENVLHVTVRDISQRAIMLNKLIESESFNKGVISSLSNHIAVIDKQGIIVATNNAWNNFSVNNGDSNLARTSVGTNYIEVCKKSAANGDQLAQQVLVGINNLLNKKKQGFNLEYPCPSSEKQRWFLLHIEPFNDNSNRLVLSHTNITARKVAQLKNEKSFLNLNEAQRMAKIGNWEFNPNKKEIFFSDEVYNIFGINKKPTNLYEIYRSKCSIDDIKTLDQLVKNAINNGEGYVVQYYIKGKKKVAKYIEEICEVIKSENGEILSLKGTMQDVSNEKKTRDELIQKNKDLLKTNEELDRFVYSASHDLRAPLTSLRGLINISEMCLLLGQEDLKEQLHLMSKTIDKMDVFISDILDYSKNSKADVVHEHIDFKDLINSSWKNLKYMNIKSNHEINVEVIQQNGFLSDKNRIEVIFNNLISNALKYYDSSKSKHILNISVKTDLNKAVITVKDNGIGIGKEHIDKVFDMFFRATKFSSGSGMGMYIVKETIDKLQGTIKVESTLNKWTKFSFSIPSSN